jgi:hypothetical protein
MKPPTHLEQLAIQAHRADDTWATFWRHYGPLVIALEPHDRQRFHRLIRRLTSLVATGDTDGMTAVGDSALREEGDGPAFPVVSDTETQARCLWRASLTGVNYNPPEPAASTARRKLPPRQRSNES